MIRAQQKEGAERPRQRQEEGRCVRTLENLNNELTLPIWTNRLHLGLEYLCAARPTRVLLHPHCTTRALTAPLTAPLTATLTAPLAPHCTP
eukprot:scaffold41350_cov62-Phaeocystis_antarctica.AAC.5